MNLKPIIWTDEMDATIRRMWFSSCVYAIAGAVGVSRTSIWKRASRSLGLPPKRRYVATQPSKKAWIVAATNAAQAAGISLDEVLSGKSFKAVHARWEAYAAVLQKSPGVSIAGLGRVSGYHHATIMHGLLRRQGKGYKEVRATGKSIVELREAA